VSIEKWPTAISLNWQPPRLTNGQITGTFAAALLLNTWKQNAAFFIFSKNRVLIFHLLL